MSTRTVVLLLLFAAGSALLALFALQNSAREVEISLDLGFAAWKLSRPLNAPTLLAIGFGSGLLTAGLLKLLFRSRGRTAWE